MNIPAFPLCWPDRFPRSRPDRRQTGAFKTSLAGALKNVKDSLRMFAADSGKKLDDTVISSNCSLGTERPSDPGVAVWFVWDGLRVCIAVDRYSKVEANLQAIHHVLEARRVELRHGGMDIVRATFTGFLALPAPTPARAWPEVLNLPAHAPTNDIRSRYRDLAKERHPDTGGSDAAFAELGAAYKAAMAERGES